MIRKRLIISGSVQGVGFRYRAYYAANELGLTGFVENRYDGTVLMEVQGTREEIDKLLYTIDQGRFIHIDGIKAENIALCEDERSFRVRGY